ncbi:MAG: cytochrome b/b6 domain-containing protein [Tabrizicola sp.]|uniref:cytochrome b n=1 Tax=Tabrizicola sp. TaxID=2005166 RepID=UPI0027371EC7|nr:cytochrome b/b6 domain-containing protein [Tabrizicola sp.]MDP3261908.1 cytochrome b/b6 domain-containing protein [Tabrizicola sp.]MDP3649994.1 cytochrome b/b6 domain-containing protein [Paracoccaceae bacterium]MDZ4069346.1 cytochrome b/b6 domain-containing protein [Tabrizicola sp.]
MSAPTAYSRTQIVLHWIIAVLIIGNLIFGEEIGDAYDTLRDTGVANYDLMTLGHIGAGVLVLLFGIWRLGLRLRRGVPETTGAGSALTDRASAVVHWVFYALILAVPTTGLAAWFGGLHEAADLHELAKPVFIVLIAAHVAGALWHHFWLKDGLLDRMRMARQA